MASYRTIDVRMWGDERFRQLSPLPPSGQSLWMYLLVGPHTTNVPGCSSIGRAALIERLGWTKRQFDRCLQEAEQLGFLLADWEAPFIWVRNAIRYNRPESPSVVTSWRRTWDELPECALKDQARQGIREQLPQSFLRAFDEACPPRQTAPPTAAQSARQTARQSAPQTAPQTPFSPSDSPLQNQNQEQDQVGTTEGDPTPRPWTAGPALFPAVRGSTGRRDPAPRHGEAVEIRELRDRHRHGPRGHDPPGDRRRELEENIAATEAAVRELRERYGRARPGSQASVVAENRLQRAKWELQRDQGELAQLAEDG